MSIPALTAQNLRFPGQWFQAETGLHQNWMRDYDPTTGRYLQADPLGLVDGPSVYGYARQSPMRRTDPTGEFSITGLPIVHDFMEGAADTGMAAACLYTNLETMQRLMVEESDKYFHCKAHCCAEKLGVGQCALAISDTREDLQDLAGEESEAERISDRYWDGLANEWGLIPSGSQSCINICSPFRVKGIPKGY